MKFKTLITAVSLFSNFGDAAGTNCQTVLKQADSELVKVSLPRTESEKNFSTLETAQTRKFLTGVDPELSQRMNEWADANIPKNAALRTSYFGVEYEISKAGIVEHRGAQQKIIFSSELLPKDASLADFRRSPDGQYLLVGHSYFGSDWQIWRTFSIKEKKFLGSEMVFKNFGSAPSFSPDSRSIIYVNELDISSDLTGKRKIQIKTQSLANTGGKSKVLFEDFENPGTSRWQAQIVKSDTAIVYRTQGVATIPMSLFKVSLEDSKITPLTMPNQFHATTPGSAILGFVNGTVYLRSSQAGNNFGIVAIDIRTGKSRVLIRANESLVLQQSNLVGDLIVGAYIDRHLNSVFRMFDLAGNLIKEFRPSDFGLEDAGQPSIPFINSNATSSAGYFTYSSVENDPVTFKIDVKDRKVEKLESGSINFNGKLIKRQLVEYTSFDGKKIKMFAYYSKNREGMKPNFAYLYRYGFIGLSNLPHYNRKFQMALNLGGMVLLPAIRGGGEEGLIHQLSGSKDRMVTAKDNVYASRWFRSQFKDVPVIDVGRSFGGLLSLINYTHFHKEFDLFSSIVPVADAIDSIRTMAWWALDDHGVNRNPRTGKVDPKNLDELIARMSKWNVTDHLGKLNEYEQLAPLLITSGEYDTNSNPIQASMITKKLKELFPEAPIHLIEYERSGHGARKELLDEFRLIALHLKLTAKDFQPLVKQN